jgi:mannose-6-phosphate isomerase-like protein (cupin superfamily)
MDAAMSGRMQAEITIMTRLLVSCLRHSLRRRRASARTIVRPVLTLGEKGVGGTTLLIVGLIMFAAASAAAQEPTCKDCPGTYIPNEEIQAYLKRAVAANTIDQQVRAVDVGKSNVAIGLVHRARLTKPQPVAEHDLVSEVYHIISGTATLVLGPDLVNKERRPADNVAVRMLNGPGNNAASIRNGVSHELKAGDVVVIPAGTGHWFTKIDDHITYLMVRIDPDKAAPLKTEAQSKADLAGKP